MKNKNTLGGLILLIIGGLALAAQSLFGGRSLYVAAANTYDAALEVSENSVVRTNDAALTQRWLLVKEGATPGTTCAINTDGDKPLGVVDNTEASTGVRQTVLRLGVNMTRKMVAAGEITVGADVYTADDGEVQALPAVAGRYYRVGRALTASGVDQNLIEVETCYPVPVQVVAAAADLAALKATLAAPAEIAFLQA